MSEDLPELPEGWVWTKLINVCHYMPTGVEKFDGEVEYCSTGSIQGDTFKPVGRYSFSKRPSRANRMGKKGDVLQARMAGTNKAVLIGEELNNKLFSTGFIQLRGPKSAPGMSSYIYYYVQSNLFLKQRDAFATGSTQVALTDGGAQKIIFPLSPLPEQKHIVSKIEELFTILDAGVRALEKTKAQLKSYRQSVLKAAFEGKLTEEWREAHKEELEPVSVLMDKIKEKRKKKLGKKYKELPPVDTSKLPELPEEWIWSRLGEVSEIIMGQSPPGSSYNQESVGVPLINGPVEFGPTPFSKTIKSKFTTSPKKMCKENDLILCVRGSTTGRMNIAGFEACVGRGVAALRSFLHQQYINFFVHSIEARIFELGTGSTFPNVTINDLYHIPVAIPPLFEQQKIVEEIEGCLSVADEIEKTVNLSFKQSERLRQSILKKAFSGKLVPQDPSDEPASVLLERIKEEKARKNRKNKKGS